MDELLEQFVIEGRELVQLASDDLMALEHDPTDAARIDGAFRAVHTLKGSAAIMDFAAMGGALHEAETVLAAIRDGQLDADRRSIDALLECIGITEQWIDEVSRVGRLPDRAAADGQRLERSLRAVLSDRSKSPPSGDTNDDWIPAALERHARAVAEIRAGGRTVVAVRYVPNADCFFAGHDPLALVQSVSQLIGLHIEARTQFSVSEFDPFTCNLVLEAISAAPIADVRAIFQPVSDQVAIVESAPEIVKAPHAGARALYVDTARIDTLVDIVGELIVAKNTLGHLATRASEADPRLARALNANQSDLDRLIGNMHRAVMGVRMTPLTRTFRRFPRLVREIADRLGKEIIFEARGDEVEADKTIVDGIFEPLLHVLRNAVDHGIEEPRVRLARGKPAAGRIILDGHREADRIVITVSDDGPGINLDKVRQATKARNLMSDAALEALSDDAVAGLIFTPGLSTAEAVTEVSGRGVGMDSVRVAIEALGGRVGVTTAAGAGSTIRLTLPQAALVTTVMTVRVGQERFGVPIEAIAETARIPTTHIIPVRSGEAFVLRDRTLPLVRLSALLALQSAPRPAAGVRVIVIICGDDRVGVEIDDFAERIDVLVRPMIGLLSGMTGILGSALLGDGHILLILDLPELLG